MRAGKHAPSRAARPSINSYSARASDTPHAADEWLSLPPLDDLIDGVNRFTRYYFQLGFIPRQQYPERLRADFRSANVFLLLSILSISARLSPPLSRYYGGGMEAAKYFTNRASALALHEIYEEPTLERCQAFYLLSIAQQGSGDSNKSYVRYTNPQATLRTNTSDRSTWGYPSAWPPSCASTEKKHTASTTQRPTPSSAPSPPAAP